MSKSIMFSLVVSMFPVLAHAQYMGLDQVPVSKGDYNKVFLTAVKSKDFTSISAWKDKITQVYDQKGLCAFSNGGYAYPATNVDKSVVDAGYQSDKLKAFMQNSYVGVVPSTCDSVSVWTLYNQLDGDQYSYDIFKSTGEMSRLESDHVPAADTYEKNRDTILEFMNNIPNDKYQLFLPLIFQNDADFKIRNLAFDKYIAGRNAEAGKAEDPQDLDVQLKAEIKQAMDNKEWIDTFQDTTYMSLFQPDLLILTQMNKKVFDTLYVYWDFYKNNPQVLPPFDESVIAKGGYTDDELKKMKLNSLSEIELYRLYNTNQVIRLFYRAYQNYIKDGNDLNIQKDDGNTMLTEMMSNQDYKVAYNPFAASFVRFYLENGANPLLQNKNGDTAFSAYMKNYGNDEATSEIKKAFVEKQYIFNLKDVRLD